MNRYIGAEDPGFGGMPDRDYLKDVCQLNGESDETYNAFLKLARERVFFAV